MIIYSFGHITIIIIIIIIVIIIIMVGWLSFLIGRILCHVPLRSVKMWRRPSGMGMSMAC